MTRRPKTISGLALALLLTGCSFQARGGPTATPIESPTAAPATMALATSTSGAPVATVESSRATAPPTDTPLALSSPTAPPATTVPTQAPPISPTPEATATEEVPTTATPSRNQPASEQDVLAATPPRDPVDLARRLRFSSVEAVPTASTSNDRQVGAHEVFWIADMANHDYLSFPATLQYVTPHLAMYVQDGVPFDPEALHRAADQFERSIYPTDRRIFGLERSPGPDGDARISVVNGKIPGVGGYFSPEDEYAQNVTMYSNNRQIIYMNVESSQPGTDYYAATLAHEFQHMIEFHVRPHAEGWLNEGASILAQQVNGLPVDGFAMAYLNDPDTQLNSWEPNPSANAAHYGASYLWLEYITEHYGGPRIMRSILASSMPALADFDAFFHSISPPRSLPDVLDDWVVANYLNDSKLLNGQYGYAHVIGHAAVTSQLSGQLPMNVLVQPYAARYVAVTQPAGATVHVGCSPTTRLMHHDLPSQADAEWWSNRDDQMDTTLTRQVDLTHVPSAHLAYDVWFDVERTFDYGFVEASTDDRTWKTLATSDTTTANPNGANYGNGYTGTSSSDGTSSPMWLHDSVDLTSYAGRRIWLRFEYITDASYNGPGIALADIAIPEIGWYDDPLRPAGWTADGWLATDNRVPQRCSVQAIEQGEQTTVAPVPLDGQQEGSMTFSTSGTRHVVLALTAFAPKTTEPVTFTLSLEPALEQ